MTISFVCRAGLRLQAFLFLLVLLLAPALQTEAQVGTSGIDPDPSSGMRQGRNTLVGKVLSPSGNQIDRHVTVRLISVAVPEFSTMTDDSGVFTFRRLKDGSYTVTVEAGRDYLPASAQVEFYDNTGRTEMVQIQLRAKPNPVSKAAVIDAGLADVPRDAAELYRQGVRSAAAGDNTKAIEQFKGAVAIYPKFVQALNELSAAYLSLGDLANAVEAIATALKNQPDNPVLRLNYGYVLLLQEKFVDAERELHRAVQLKDSSTLAHLYRGRVLIRLRNFDEAEKELNRALSLGGASGIVAYRYLGALYSERGETSKAISALENYLKLTPNSKDSEQVQAVLRQLREEAAKKKN